MILVDASVYIARLRQEPGWEDLCAPLTDTPHAVAASTLCEVGLRVRRLTTGDRMRAVMAAIRTSASEIIVIDAAIAEASNEAFDRYGKGTGHPAKLNLGDCLVYAAARHRDLQLLFKGDDFGRTDLNLHPASQTDADAIEPPQARG